MNRPPVPVALIGCGAVAELYHAPALAALAVQKNLRVAALVDPDPARRLRLGDLFPKARQLASELDLIPGEVEAAIIASPQRFHAPQTLTLLAKGAHVFCEKPMSTDAAGARQMIDAARAANRILTVGLFRRHFPSSRFIRDLIVNRNLGAVQSFEWSEGGPFGWPAVSTSFFQKTHSAGGVLADVGAHVLDLLLWWFGAPNDIKCEDDACGGLEANSALSLHFAGGVVGRVRLSRDTAIPVGTRVEFERGTVWFAGASADSVAVCPKNGAFVARARLYNPPTITEKGYGTPAAGYESSFLTQITAFVDAIRDGVTPLVTAEEALAGQELIGQCYAARLPMSLPWLSPVERVNEDISSRHSLTTTERACVKTAIIGAGGFVGSRTMELFHLRDGWPVVPVIRSNRALATIARFDLDWRMADACDTSKLAKALEGCSNVVHAAVGDPHMIEGCARALIPAAARAGVRRVVYLSTASVHGQSPARGSDETSPLNDHQDYAYNNAKVRAEREIFAAARRHQIEVIVLRPCIIYGPRDSWVSRIASELHAGTAWLIDGEPGWCNTAYVDNVVHAVRCSLLAPSSATGQAYLVGDDEPVTWKMLYESTATLIGVERATIHHVPAPAFASPGWKRHVEALRSARWSMALSGAIPSRPKRLVKALLNAWPAPERPSHWALAARTPALRLDRERVRLQQCAWRFPCQKAREALGYSPEVTFAEGLERTAGWLRWAGLAPGKAPS